MIRPPPPWAIICLAASWVPKKALFRLTSITFSYCSSVVSSTEVRVSMPALLTMMSRRPKLLDRRVDEHLQVGDLADVGLHPDGLVAQRRDLLLEVLGGRLVGDVVDHDVGPGAGQSQNDGLADPELPPVTMATFPLSVITSPLVRELRSVAYSWRTCREVWSDPDCHLHPMGGSDRHRTGGNRPGVGPSSAVVRGVDCHPGRAAKPLRDLLGLDQLGDRLDQGQMGEGLGEVAQVLTGGGVDLLGVELEGSGEGQQLLAQVPGPARSPRSWPGR